MSDSEREYPEMREAHTVRVWDGEGKKPTVFAPVEVEEDGELVPSTVLYAGIDGTTLYLETYRLEGDEEVLESSRAFGGMKFDIEFMEDDEG